MKFRLLALIALLATSPVSAATIVVNSNTAAGISGVDRNGAPTTITSDGTNWLLGPNLGYWEVLLPFTLPANYVAASLNISSIAADDRVGVFLNGVLIGGTGIFGPQNGGVIQVGPAPLQNVAINYLANGSSVSANAPFLVGANLLRFVVNDTFAGVGGSTVPDGQAGPTSLAVVGEITYRVDGGGQDVSEPATLALLGAGLLGLAAVRRRKSA